MSRFLPGSPPGWFGSGCRRAHPRISSWAWGGTTPRSRRARVGDRLLKRGEGKVSLFSLSNLAQNLFGRNSCLDHLRDFYAGRPRADGHQTRGPTQLRTAGPRRQRCLRPLHLMATSSLPPIHSPPAVNNEEDGWWASSQNGHILVVLDEHSR